MHEFKPLEPSLARRSTFIDLQEETKVVHGPLWRSPDEPRILDPMQSLGQRNVLATGDIVDGYEVTSCISIRDKHHLYLAQHRSQPFPVVLKIVAIEEPVIRRELISQLKHESQILSSLSHRSLPRVWDFYENEDRPLLVLEWAGPNNLDQVLAERKRLDVRTTLHLGIEMIDILEYLASENIVHRDIKPANLMTLPGGAVKLIDFGIAIKLSTHSAHAKPRKIEEFVGTAHYTSPEQALSDPKLDGRADLYSLGVVLYQCLTGVVPFEDVKENKILLRQIREEPLPVHRHRQDVPFAVSEFISHLLAKKPQDRPSQYGKIRNHMLALSKEYVIRRDTITVPAST